ncbi:MAG: DUF664 domain-containing protein [Burkholderiales bacterium]|nr:MAG: DUF664 domain-containing protein [Burkholderiales bacterium]TAG82800.1 MAG: DUF664 domain-containing protein [Betaproteobacteria bacterium]
MITTAYCQHMARYNRWQNQSVYAACEKLTDDTRKRNMGAFFKSIHNTLNHLMVADRLWLSRFDGEPAGDIYSLDQVLYTDFEELKKQRGFTDDRADRYIATLTQARIDSALTFRRVGGNKDEVSMPMHICLMHYFSHGTHHRGQVTTLLMQCGVDPGVTDLPWLPKDFASPIFGLGQG